MHSLLGLSGIERYYLRRAYINSVVPMQLSVTMEGTVFTPALEGMKHVKSEQGEMLTKPFLEVCKMILPVIGKK